MDSVHILFNYQTLYQKGQSSCSITVCQGGIKYGNRVPRKRRISSIAMTPNIRCFVAKTCNYDIFVAKTRNYNIFVAKTRNYDIFVAKTRNYDIFVAKTRNYDIFVAKIYDYALIDSFWGFPRFIDSPTSYATLLSATTISACRMRKSLKLHICQDLILVR